MTRRATAQDVADLAGVSRSAVSLVLNGRAAGNISPVKQEAVREAARQLSYTPNAVALSLRSKRTAMIGVLTWADQRQVYPALLGAVYAAASRAGYLLLMGDVVRRPRELDSLVDRRVDGFVVVAPELTEFVVPEPLDSVPTVLVNCVDPSLRTTSLVWDEVGAGSSAARVLIEAGHRSIGVVCGVDGLSSERRVQGVQRALGAAGLVPACIVRAGRTIADGFAAAGMVLDSPDPPTALVCTHERLAAGVLAAVADRHLRVPHDLSMMSLDDGQLLAGQLVPAVDLVERAADAVVTHALELLVDQLQNGRGNARQLSFACPVRRGQTVTRPRRSWPASREARRPGSS